MIERLLYRALPLALCLGLLLVLRWSALGVAGTGVHGTTVALAFLLIGAFIAGQVAEHFGAPRITAFLAVGLVCGPHVSALFTKDMMAAARTVDGMAIVLLALTAGGEIKLSWLRERLVAITAIATCELALVGTAVFLTILAVHPLVSFMPSDWPGVLAVATVFSAVAMSSSPAVTIAMLNETRAEGPVARTVLGVTVLKDIAVLILFTIAVAVARDLLGISQHGTVAGHIARALGGSALLGVGVGVVFAFLAGRFERDLPLVVIGICFGVHQLSAISELEPLLVALVAGVWMQNASTRGPSVIAAIERVSLPLYAVFFAAAGTKIDLRALASTWPLAMVVVVVRTACVFAGTRLGAKLARAEPAVQRLAWMGFVSQAGISLALAAVVAQAFPSFGPQVQVVLIAIIAVHEVVGPVLFQRGLTLAGEVRGPSTPAESVAEPPARALPPPLA